MAEDRLSAVSAPGREEAQAGPAGLSRKQKGSSNRDKARIKVARAHARVADARREFHHQLSTALIRENQAVAVEDLAVKGLARTRMAKSVHDAGWSAFVAMLEYKARLYGRESSIRIDRFEPTSQVCSACGSKTAQSPCTSGSGSANACGACARPRHQRCGQRCQGRRTGGSSLWSAGKARAQPGTARRSRNPPRATPANGVTDGNPGPSAGMEVNTSASSPDFRPVGCLAEHPARPAEAPQASHPG